MSNSAFLLRLSFRFFFGEQIHLSLKKDLDALYEIYLIL